MGRHVKARHVYVQLQKQIKGNQIQEVGRMDADLVLSLISLHYKRCRPDVYAGQ